jgi:hypothetical protein
MDESGAFTVTVSGPEETVTKGELYMHEAVEKVASLVSTAAIVFSTRRATVCATTSFVRLRLPSKLGTITAPSIETMLITIRSSISVNPFCLICILHTLIIMARDFIPSQGFLND